EMRPRSSVTSNQPSWRTLSPALEIAPLIALLMLSSEVATRSMTLKTSSDMIASPDVLLRFRLLFLAEAKPIIQPDRLRPAGKLCVRCRKLWHRQYSLGNGFLHSARRKRPIYM